MKAKPERLIDAVEVELPGVDSWLESLWWGQLREQVSPRLWCVERVLKTYRAVVEDGEVVVVVSRGG